MQLNKVLLVGNLGSDPEVKYLPSGDPVADFRIAVNRRYKDRQGEYKDETAWVGITCFGPRVEFCSKYLVKGKAVFVEGRLRMQSWETQDGQKRSKLDVVAERIQFAYPRSAEGDGPSSSATAPPDAAPSRDVAQPQQETVDDLPF